MKIGIYNSYMNTMGGGEKHMGAIAEYLSKQPNTTVDILTEHTTHLDDVSEKLQLDLSRCTVVVLDEEGESVEEVSAQYDLFVNATHWSHIKPRAKKNAILVFFPIIPKLRFLARSALFIRLLDVIDDTSTARLSAGAYSREKIGKGFRRTFGQWTRKEFTICVEPATTGKQYITIGTKNLRGTPLSDLIEEVTDEAGASIRYVVKGNRIQFRLHAQKGHSQRFTIKLASTFQPNTDDARELGIFVTHTHSRPPVRYVRRRLLICMGTLLASVRHYNYLGSYDVIMSNSEYTRSWIQRLWRRDSEIVYPIIEVDAFPPKKKKHIVLSVGRFFAGGHNKKHLTMIQAFKDMYLAGQTGDWEYHLCGGTHEEKEHQEYLSQVQEEALGYPITIHPDIPFEQLKEMYGEAAIFWHASGYGEDEKKHPDRFEHFGITTVEAMSAACIPVVIGKAGQKEIVSDGKNGYLWMNPRQLKERTRHLMRMQEEKRTTLSQAAQQRATDFRAEECHKRIREVFERLLTN